MVNKVDRNNQIVIIKFKDVLNNFQCKNDRKYNFICEDNVIHTSTCKYDNSDDIVFTFDNVFTTKCFLLSDYNGNSIPLEQSEISNIMVYKNNKLLFPSSLSSKVMRMINNNNNDIFLYLGKEDGSSFSINGDEIVIDLSSISNNMNENILYNNLENGANIIIRELTSMNELYTTIMKVYRSRENNKILTIKTSDSIDSIDSLKSSRILSSSSSSEVKSNHKNRLRGKATITPQQEQTKEYNNNNSRKLQNTDKLYSINTFNLNSIHIEIECGGQGKCNYKTGECECYDGFEGSNCNRIQCPNNCNGYGECVLLSSILDNKELNNYVGYGNDRIYGCKCDKKRRGYDCSLIECPSGIDPEGDSNTNGLDYRDCSGRGICDYTKGVCQCFEGYRGAACEIKNNYR